MPPDPQTSAATTSRDPAITGRSCCGTATLESHQSPQMVAYCHCSDCRRWTGVPVAAFAAFGESDLRILQPSGGPVSHTAGVERSFCRDCGSPLAARFDYLPGQLFVPVGLLDQAAVLPPHLHCHIGTRLPWLHIADDLPRRDGSGRATLTASGGSH